MSTYSGPGTVVDTGYTTMSRKDKVSALMEFSIELSRHYKYDFKAHDVVSITPYVFDLGIQCLFTQL